MPRVALDNPEMAIIPDPCGASPDEARNWDNVRRIISQIVTILNNEAGTLIASCTLVDDGTNCIPDIATIADGTFLPFAIENPDDPIPVPTTVYNRIGSAISGNPYALIVRNPNADPGAQWEVLKIAEVAFDAVSSVQKSGSSCTYSYGTFTAPSCNVTGSGTVFTTTTQIALYNVGNDCNTGSFTSQEVTMEVFSKTVDPTVYVEFAWSTLLVLTDVYQSTAYGNIIGFYYRAYLPCSDLVGEDPLIFVDRCTSGNS